MIDFSGKRVLMLQGPMGPFFRRMAMDLLGGESKLVHKVNFNGGDRYFFPGGIDFTGKIDEWREFLSSLILEYSYDKIVLFGDTRPMHSIAVDVAREHGIRVIVFEEGYLRPHFITCEAGGVNGFSRLPRDRDFYKNSPLVDVALDAIPRKFRPSRAAWYYAWKYGYEQKKHRNEFRHYSHVRELSWVEGFRWVAWTARKKLLKMGADRLKVSAFLSGGGDKFLIPLQVAADSQVIHHSPFGSVAEFIEKAIGLFAVNSAAGAKLLIKHHPLDPHHNYDSLIDRLAQQHGCRDRIWYVVEGNLPDLLKAVDGVLTINSTVGLSALHHGVPTCVMGDSVYRMSGLATDDVVSFLASPSRYIPDKDLFLRFKGYLLTHNQAVGSFYKPMRLADSCSGVLWPKAVAFPNKKRVGHAKRTVRPVPSRIGLALQSLMSVAGGGGWV